MYEPLKNRLLRFLRVPPEPEDPRGAGESLLVFRAAPNYYKYKLILWAIGQVFVIPLWLGGTIALLSFALTVDVAIGRFFLFAAGALLLMALVVVVPLSYMMVRLDYEMRWYKVTDQSLRIREGVAHVREMTMTFANIQNISISQGPIQRALGIADLKVQSAGGGGGGSSQKEQQQGFGLDMHTGYFRGVDNAEHIRDTMRFRLRASRDSGLGDPDQAAAAEAPATVPAASGALLEVLPGLRTEAAAFRRAAEQAAGGLRT